MHCSNVLGVLITVLLSGAQHYQLPVGKALFTH